MRFITIIPTAAALLSFAAAQVTTDEDTSLPPPPPPPEMVEPQAGDGTLEEREFTYGNELGVFLCTDPNWKGGCLHQTPIRHGCVSLGGGIGDNIISSFGPDRNTKCDLFDLPDCNGSGVKGDAVREVRWPGIPDLNTVKMNDRISSYRCVETDW